MTEEQNVHLLLRMRVGGRHRFTFFSLFISLSCAHYTSQCSGSKSVRTFVVVMVTGIKS